MIEENGIFRHPTALIHGAVSLAAGVSLWPYAVIRAEMHKVVVGRFSNIQDFVMVHIGYGSDTVIGEYCSIAHHSTIHGCTIGNNCLVGINATIMDGAVIGDNCIIAGHALVKEGTVVPPNSVVAGVPAKVLRPMPDPLPNVVNALLYYRNAKAYVAGDHRAWASIETGQLHEEASAILAKQCSSLG